MRLKHSAEMRSLITALSMVILLGCEGSGIGSGQKDAEVSGDASGIGNCDPLGPADPGAVECRAWTCALTAYPACWQCDHVGDVTQDGTPCTIPGSGDAGQCEAGTCGAITLPDDPADPGPFTVDSNVTTLSVPGGIAIPLTVYVPVGSATYPVVLFSHGFQLTPADYVNTVEHLASWGFVVVVPELPGSLFSPTVHRVLKDYLIAILDWIEAEGGNLSGALNGKGDVNKLGLAGHSMGGKISLLVASADSRPLAVFGVDPVDSGPPFGSNPTDYPSVTPELMPQITVPLGLLGETTNSGGMQPCAPADDNFHQYFQHATSPAVELELVGASHMSFLDNPNCGLVCSACPAGSDDTAVTRRLTRRYLTAFMKTFLAGELGFKGYLVGPSMQTDVAAGLVLTATKNGF